MMKHPIIFTGAGPGDPELITVKGKLALEQADLVVYAGSLVPEAVLKWAGSETVFVNSASMHFEEIIDTMVNAYNEGKHIVRLHTGDPSLYGAIFEQTEELKKRSVQFSVIPGVTAAFAAAAAIGMEYTMPEISQTLILTRMSGRTPVPDAESLESLASHETSMVIYLSISLTDKVTEILGKAYGKDAPAVVAYCVSQPEEIILRTTIGELPDAVKQNNIKKQAVIIVGKVLGNSQGKYKSRLYDKSFSHEFRRECV
ncbi:MAG: precorrin-4 C(11)-methyltransferase [Desulfobacteraceae bacterium]|nr:precorrin-4 C(11)-methyltransferase [Desulfobacteraceae bacterium]